MGWIDNITLAISPKRAYKRIAWRNGYDELRNYDSGKDDRLNYGWRTTNQPGEQTDAAYRDIIRARARDLERNSDMFNSIILDWYSRFIVGWSLSDTLDTAPVLNAIKRAITDYGTPGILNSDQGSQFSSDEYRQYLKGQGIRQSMDSKARWVDNVIIERWFRSLKTEYVYINEYCNPKELRAGIRQYIEEYNHMRPHQSHDYDTPALVYGSKFAA